MPKSLSSVIALSIACLSTHALADLTVASQGGANKNAQQQAYYQPYSAQTGSRIIADEFNGEMAKVKIQVDTGSVSWDVVELETPELLRACDEGLVTDRGACNGMLASLQAAVASHDRGAHRPTEVNQLGAVLNQLDAKLDRVDPVFGARLRGWVTDLVAAH